MVVFLLIMFGYKLFTIDKVFLNENDNTTQKLYINFFDPKLFTFTFYQYDQRLQHNKVLLKKNIKDYTSFAYSESHNKLFFADKAKDNTMQLFVMDLQTEQIRQLTSKLSHVDFIQIDKKQAIIFMRVLLKDKYRNFHIATYNIATNELKIWDEADKDKNIFDFNYNPNNNKVLVVSFSEAEDTKKLEEANEKQTTLLPPKYSIDIYNVNGNKEKPITLIDKFISGASLAFDKNLVLFSYDENHDNPISHVVEMDINTKKIKPLLKSTEKYFKIRAVKYDEKEEGFFFLSSSYNSQNGNNALEVPKESILSYYDIKEQKIKDIWRTDKGVIVNYSVGMR